MNCEQAEELLGAYALDALPVDEMAAVRAHLSSCAEHAAKAHELRAVALTLADATDPIAPPAALRSSIAAAVAAETATPSRPATTPASLAARRERKRWFAPSPTWGAIAAVLVIAVIGLAAWNIALRSDSSSPEVFAVRALEQDSGAVGGYAVMFDDGTMAVYGSALPRLDVSQQYQLWSLSEDGEPTSLGLMDYNDAGTAVANVALDLANTAAVAITIEPAGGSEQPSGPPVYVTGT
jgi:anti-sigma-K factor RskA